MNHSDIAGAQPCLSRRSSMPVSFTGLRFRVRQYITAMTVGIAVVATSPAFASDPCKTVLCMFGKLTGNSGGGECSSAEQDYFDILVKKHGKVNWSKTATARGDFLNSCPGADKGPNKKINDTFGKVFG